MLKYWHRARDLHHNTLANKALLENFNLRTNWIVTIEKLMNCFKLTNSIQEIDTLDIRNQQCVNYI